MLIQSRDYVREHRRRRVASWHCTARKRWADLVHLQDEHAAARHLPTPTSASSDTLREPQHRTKTGELRRFDRVLANPPFCQNYIKKDIKFPGRFPVSMPEKGKKADLMFVQHMLAVLKSDGRLATVMPHGVLFRGGEEREAAPALHRQRLSRGRHRPAGQPVLRHRHSGLRPGAATRTRSQGRARQGALHQRRPRVPRRQGPELTAARGHREDRPRLPHAARLPAYARRRAGQRNQGGRIQLQHPPLRGQRAAARTARRAGAPAWRRPGREVDGLPHFWQNYDGLRESCFVPRTAEEHGTYYADFATALQDKRAIAEHVNAHHGVHPAAGAIHCRPASVVAAAPAPDRGTGARCRQTARHGRNVYAVRATLLDSIEHTFAGQHLLNRYQVRGAFANYYKLLASDFKSIAASGWGPD